MLSKRECDSISLNSYKKQWFGVEVCRLRLGSYLNFVYYESDSRIVSYEVFYTKNTFELRRKVDGGRTTAQNNWETILPPDVIGSPLNVSEDENLMVHAMMGLDSLELAIYDMSIEAVKLDYIENTLEEGIKKFLSEKLKDHFHKELYLL
ncbi:putative holin [Escherichia phage JLBYU08]|nr:putative holin [Escherichia phage JLBYU08]